MSNIYKVRLNDDRIPFLVKEGECNILETICTTSDVHDMFTHRPFNMDKEMQEYVYCVGLGGKNIIKGISLISIGNCCTSIVDMKGVFTRLILMGAASFILVHNHPSGDCTPSQEDRDIITKLQAAGDILAIRMLDFMIIGNKSYWSLSNEQNL